MLRPFRQAVVCCCILVRVFGSCCQNLKPVKRLATCKRTQQLPTRIANMLNYIVAKFPLMLASSFASGCHNTILIMTDLVFRTFVIMPTWTQQVGKDKAIYHSFQIFRRSWLSLFL